MRCARATSPSNGTARASTMACFASATSSVIPPSMASNGRIVSSAARQKKIARIGAGICRARGRKRMISRRSTLASWPRHRNSRPVQVSRTRLHWSQKLWLSGVMKPMRWPSAVRA